MELGGLSRTGSSFFGETNVFCRVRSLFLVLTFYYLKKDRKEVRLSDIFLADVG